MLRILSDLHFRDARTQVRELRQLEPLLAGVQTLVINGDSCEMRLGTTPAQVEALRTFFRERVPEVIFITGNHDPDISDTHELLVAGGQVWVTHGDVCFADLTPWSRHAAELRRRVEAELAAVPVADRERLDLRLQVARRVARAEQNLPDLSEDGWWGHLKWAWHTFFPPRVVLAMLRSWRDLPGRAARLAVTQRSAARVVVMGHVHFPGVWRRPGGPTIINTGSFFRPLGGSLVDVLDDRVRVNRIVRRDSGFHPGRMLAEIRLGNPAG